MWVQCVKALTNLIKQTVTKDSDGNITSNEVYDQLTMIARCLPILLLRVPPLATHKGKQQIMRHNCNLFLKGSWRSLVCKARRELEELNERAHKRTASHPTLSGSSRSKEQTVLDRARSLQYSRAMNILRSPGLAEDSGDQIHAALQKLHPHEQDPHIDESSPRVPHPASSFDFITGSWFSNLIARSKRGTAVDQWGWDSKEMWSPLTSDSELMDDMAQVWALPVATGYLPRRYRDHLAGGRLIALSKHPKPGVRPICISDAIRRLVAKGLLACSKASFTHEFQNAHPRALQFGANLQNKATHMFHLISGAIHEAAALTGEDPFAIASIDVKNAFNTLSRAHLAKILLQSCPPSRPFALTRLDHDNAPADLGIDILWRHFQAHYGCRGILKCFHQGTTYQILSASGVQQGDPLGTSLFALGNHPCLLEVANRHPAILATGYADNTFLLGPLGDVTRAISDFEEILRGAYLQLNTSESELLVPQWIDLEPAVLAEQGNISWSDLHNCLVFSLNNRKAFQ